MLASATCSAAALAASKLSAVPLETRSGRVFSPIASLHLPGRHTPFEGHLQEQFGQVSHDGSLGPHWRGKRFPFDISHLRPHPRREREAGSLPPRIAARQWLGLNGTLSSQVRLASSTCGGAG